jgi:hypothetical protein
MAYPAGGWTQKKDGGAYVTTTGTLKLIDEHEPALVMADRERIAISDILDIDSELLRPEILKIIGRCLLV